MSIQIILGVREGLGGKIKDFSSVIVMAPKLGLGEQFGLKSKAS